MTQTAAPDVNQSTHSRSPDEFDLWMQRIRMRAVSAAGPFFLVAPARPLFDVFLDSFGPADKEGEPPTPAGRARQLHNCACCRHFLRRYGGVVTVDPGGILKPLFWNITATGPYAHAEHELVLAVAHAPIRDVFFDPSPAWGQERTGEWTHFGLPISLSRWTSRTKDAQQAAAEKREELQMLRRALEEFPAELAARAAALLKTDALFNSEKVLGVAEWFAALHATLAGVKHVRLRDNILWHAVAIAPAGFAHVRASMIGTLLDDPAKGLNVDQVARSFAAKMDPTRYMRPQVPPSAGNIEQAEKVFTELGTAGALKRRFARLEEVQKVWTPKYEQPRANQEPGLFSHLRPTAQVKVDQPLGAPPTKITWEKFVWSVLSTAERMECFVSPDRLPFAALVTAADAAAPPIIQWDREDKRNPVTWYVDPRGSHAQTWNLQPGIHPISAISLMPNLWDLERPMEQHGKGVVLILEGCRDLVAAQRGGGLFPQFLKNDYHAVRGTVEAHSKSMEIAGAEEATACGLILRGPEWSTIVRVASGGIKTDYLLERWD